MTDKSKEGVLTLPEWNIWIAALPATGGNRSKLIQYCTWQLVPNATRGITTKDQYHLTGVLAKLINVSKHRLLVWKYEQLLHGRALVQDVSPTARKAPAGQPTRQKKSEYFQLKTKCNTMVHVVEPHPRKEGKQKLHEAIWDGTFEIRSNEQCLHETGCYTKNADDLTPWGENPAPSNPAPSAWQTCSPEVWRTHWRWIAGLVKQVYSLATLAFDFLARHHFGCQEQVWLSKQPHWRQQVGWPQCKGHFFAKADSRGLLQQEPWTGSHR